MTAKTSNEQALSEAILPYLERLHPLPMAYAIFDANGKIRSLSPYAARLIGHAPAALIGRSLSELTASGHPSQANGHQASLNWKLSSLGDYAEQDLDILRPDGQIVWIRLTLQPIYYTNSNRIRGFHASLLDVTELRDQQKRLQHLNDHIEAHILQRTQSLMELIERLKQQNRQYAQFCHEIAHELRTPLANLTLRLHLLERGTPADRAKHEDVLNQQVKYLVRLVDNITNFARAREIDRTEFTNVNLSRVLSDVIAAHRPRAEEKCLTISVQVADEAALTVRGHAIQLAQVFSNLLGNAINYTPAGTIHITAEVDAPHQQVMLRFSDSGMGIAEDDIPHIFERFYRGRNAVQAEISGTGLGLEIVREIIKAHDGRIGVTSQLGRGTTFSIALPLVPEARASLRA